MNVAASLLWSASAVAYLADDAAAARACCAGCCGGGGRQSGVAAIELLEREKRDLAAEVAVAQV